MSVKQNSITLFTKANKQKTIKFLLVKILNRTELKSFVVVPWKLTEHCKANYTLMKEKDTVEFKIPDGSKYMPGGRQFPRKKERENARQMRQLN